MPEMSPREPLARPPGREPFADMAEAEAAAEQIRATAGWAVLAVHGGGPGGPPKTARHHWAVASERAVIGVPSPWARVRQLPPRVTTIAPDGRRVTVASWGRWDALRARYAAASRAARRDGGRRSSR